MSGWNGIHVRQRFSRLLCNAIECRFVVDSKDLKIGGFNLATRSLRNVAGLSIGWLRQQQLKIKKGATRRGERLN